MTDMNYSPTTLLENEGCAEIHFGPYRLLPQRHQLFKNEQPVSLGSRALTLLIALASRPGELLQKNELLNIAWPKLVVEECNLRTQIKTLRRTLGDDDALYIATAPGLGYRFVAPTWFERATTPVVKEPVVLGVYGCRHCRGAGMEPLFAQMGMQNS